ncbi:MULTISPECIES: RagB/SusD family nutrient uptake outer membrane protein [Butyricimonas]|uniref:RagB/SusD family nutrient uptake outer membrane protein n=1 Tax=Butyricimonas TaxID=574697 RepID=UPI001D05F593|nr:MULTISPECIES: RagB/SusD family nutrient uptake outer membrane protein [Butyricimonas]MCB6974694.1 RagB/SusD family nutrient uptake outer membrane protein [Butyricimonas synergistica]MCG4521452.1 RagB/SusD family nutrient uptake outer membrane protein [Butyricimonas sp. DFI.6.44]
MRKYRNICVALSLIFSQVLGGCSRFLEESSQDESIPTTTTDYSELLMMYMYKTQLSNYDVLFYLDDDLMLNESKLPTGSFIWGLAALSRTFTWQPDMWEQENAPDNGYTYTYTQIMGINAVLDGVENAVGTQQDRDLIRAEALGLRAFGYFRIVNMFGEPYNYNKKALGVPLKLTAALVENGIARSTVEDVYNQIVIDLEEASRLFAKYPKTRGNYRMNGTTVDILLARTYLYMEEYDKAITVATRAIESSEGLSDYTKMSYGEREFSLSTYNLSEVEWLYGYAYFDDVLSPTESLLSGFTHGDKRRDFWFPINGTEIYKLLVPGELGSGGGVRTPGYAIRISEAYLTRAEAKVLATENKDEDGALADLNELRRHRITGYTDERSTTGVLEKIRQERRLELCYEFHRWFDLRRYGMPSITRKFKQRKEDQYLIYTLNEKDLMYTLPFPLEVIDKNIQLVQNASAKAPEREGVLE